MTKPKILIPIPIQDSGNRRYTLGKNYVLSVIEAGGVPILLPTSVDSGALRETYLDVDGILLTGGDDVDPAFFDEEKHPTTDGIDIERDEVEMQLTRWAVEDDKPLFGICRGIQVMNVALGGTLIQDIPSQVTTQLTHAGHYEGARRDEVLHNVCCDPNTKLANVVGYGEIGVNSFHHQAVKRVADDLVVTARSSDDIIEAFEMPNKRLILGVQWHPEEMSFGRPDMMRLFKTLVDASAR
jgi:putative glutamine amidotransferase